MEPERLKLSLLSSPLLTVISAGTSVDGSAPLTDAPPGALPPQEVSYMLKGYSPHQGLKTSRRDSKDAASPPLQEEAIALSTI